MVSLPETRVGVCEELDRCIDNLYRLHTCMLTDLYSSVDARDGLSLVGLRSRHWMTAIHVKCQAESDLGRYLRLVFRRDNLRAYACDADAAQGLWAVTYHHQS